LVELSIIIPNTNSLLIGKIIAALKSQTIRLSNAEVIVVGSDEPGLIGKEPDIYFLPTSIHNSFASDKRNLGMRVSRGRILFFLDDDCIPSPDWLERHLWHHERGEKVVGGAVDFDLQKYIQSADNVSAFHDLLTCTSEGFRSYLATANLSVQRSVVKHAGMMIPHCNRAEDLEWTARFRTCGYRLYFEPKAVVFHDPARRSLQSVWRHWTEDAPNTLRVRLKYAPILSTPALAKHRFVYLWALPLISLWATARSFLHPKTLVKSWPTIPLVYMTKMAWCWSAYRNFASEKGF
jgi:glycosyltransferase involved in cell wall biosynthesis